MKIENKSKNKSKILNYINPNTKKSFINVLIGIYEETHAKMLQIKIKRNNNKNK